MDPSLNTLSLGRPSWDVKRYLEISYEMGLEGKRSYPPAIVGSQEVVSRVMP